MSANRAQMLVINKMDFVSMFKDRTIVHVKMATAEMEEHVAVSGVKNTNSAPNSLSYRKILTVEFFLMILRFMSKCLQIA